MLKAIVQKILANWDLEIVPKSALPPEASNRDREILSQVQPFTMTSSDRLWSLMQAVRYVVQANIAGDFVECGVWRGGSAMTMAMVLSELRRKDRRIWLYDTFEGMTPPTQHDVENHTGRTAQDLLKASGRETGRNVWCIASEEDVTANLQTTGYPSEMLTIRKGDVVQTLKQDLPERIALLRLDTDWYESTEAELQHLYPRLVSGGVCIIDDYGYWRGARKAVDEYFHAHSIHALVHKIDFTGRIFIKP